MWPDDPAQPLLRAAEPRWLRAAGLVALVAMLAVFFLYHAAFNVPAHPGVDQNGYLVGGKVLARHGTAGLTLDDPFQFVGRMWIGADLGTPDERYYPKYPPGLPLAVALGWWLGLGPTWAFWVNPVLMTLGLAATFMLVRLIAGTGLGLIATAVIATSPAIMGLTTNPNSHAGALAFAAWGLLLALSWTRPGRATYTRAVAAGLCLGIAVTFRYTEGLLLLPAVLAIVLGVRWRSLRSLAQAAAMLAAWGGVVGLMVLYNYLAFGSVTGYDPTNESTGFAWAYFLDNWDTMLRSLDGPGLFMIFPVAVAGMIGLCIWRWRVGLIIAAAIVPSLLTYTFYYWAPSPEGLGYTRFFITQFPALAACAAAAAAMLIDPAPAPGSAPGSARAQPVSHAIAPAPSRAARIGWMLGGGVVAALALLANVTIATPQLESDQLNRLHLHDQATLILEHAPPGSVIICRDQRLLHHLQFVGDYLLYSGEPFDHRTVQRYANVDPDEPQGLQPQRQLALYERLRDMNQAALTAQQQQLIDAAFADGRRVFVAQGYRNLRGRDAEQFGLWRILPADRYATTLATQWDRVAVGRIEPPDDGRRTPRHRPGARPGSRPGSDRGLLVEVTPAPAPAPGSGTARAEGSRE